MAKRRDNVAEIDFLREGLQAFLKNGDLEEMSITTDFGQIAVSRKEKRKGEVSAIGFQYEENSGRPEYEDEEEEEAKQWNGQNGKKRA